MDFVSGSPNKKGGKQMEFRAHFKGMNLKPRVLADDPERDDKPATATIQIVVENPPENLLGLLGRLANDGEPIKVALSSYQMAMRQI